jgi:predicted RNase H-like HicB family nuclease
MQQAVRETLQICCRLHVRRHWPWIAEVPQLPGALCYGKTADDAMAKAEVLALRAMADRLEQNESRPVEINISLPLAA